MSVKVSQILTRISRSGPSNGADTVAKAGDTIVFTLVTDAPVYVPNYGISDNDKPYFSLTLSNGVSAYYSGVDAQGRLEFSSTVFEGWDAADVTVTGFRSTSGTSLAASTPLPKNIDFSPGRGIDRAFDGPINGSNEIVVSDLNNDGRLDIIFARDPGNVNIYLNKGNGSFDKTLEFLSPSSNGSSEFDLKMFDFNRDGIADALVSAAGTATLSINLGLGDGTFADMKIVDQGYFYPHASGAADVDGDGNIDIVVSATGEQYGTNADGEWRSSGGLKVFYGDGTGAFTRSEKTIATQGDDFVLADLNKDGVVDLVSYNSSSIEVRFGTGDRSLNLSGTLLKPEHVRQIVASDLDADGSIDLLMTGDRVENGTVFQDSVILFGAGDGTFQAAPKATIDAFNELSKYYGQLSVADIDGDGIKDLVSYSPHWYFDYDMRRYYPHPGVDVMRGRGDGTFEPARIYPESYGINGVAVGDLNGDGKPDIVTTNEYGGLAYLPNTSVGGESQFDGASVGTAAGAQTGIRIDTTKPVFTGAAITGPGLVDGTGTLTAGQTATITLTASEVLVVKNAGSMVLSLNDGGQAVYDAAAATATQLVFRYTVAVDQVTPDLTVTGLVLNGASIWDEAGNEAVFSGAVTNPAGTLRIDGHTGTPGNDVFRGQGGAETFRGLAGDDTYYIDSPQDVVVEAAGQGFDTVVTSVSFTLGDGQEIEVLRANLDTVSTGLALTGNAFAQAITGGNGSDTLNGGGGADVMRGLAGDDTYLVDDRADQVIEAVGGGNDRVFASTSYALAAGQEIEAVQLLTATGAAKLDLTGNAFGQTLVGNAGANLLDGGGGADLMVGNRGDDTYLVDDWGDQVREAVGGGNDRVFVSTSYNLAAGQEIEAVQVLASTGTAKIDLIGNEFGQVLVGNAGANVLNGGGGADTMAGNRGDDTYVVDDARDVVIEARGGGFDTIMASVSYRIAAGVEVEAARFLNATGQLNLDLIGNAFGQALTGNAGANVLDGGGGADVLTGKAGQDAFVFSTALGAGNIDRITDFAPVDDQIRLLEDVFSAIEAGPLAASAFKNLDKAAIDADDRILYKQTTGELFYDADGTGRGAAVKFAVLDNHAKLTHDDFFVI